MRKIDSKSLLEQRSQMFRKFLGLPGEFEAGKMSFRVEDQEIDLCFESRRSVMSVTHFLSLQAALKTQTVEKESETRKKTSGRCFLGRLGGWSFRGNDPFLKNLKEALKKNQTLKKILEITDLDSIEIKTKDGGLKVVANLYGGGYSAIVLPPIQFPVGLKQEQAENCAVLFLGILKIVNEAAAA